MNSREQLEEISGRWGHPGFLPSQAEIRPRIPGPVLPLYMALHPTPEHQETMYSCLDTAMHYSCLLPCPSGEVYSDMTPESLPQIPKQKVVFSPIPFLKFYPNPYNPMHLIVSF